MKHIAQVFPLLDRMNLVALSMIDEDASRTKAIDLETSKLKLMHPHLFWNEAETKQMEALWSIQRREREIRNAKDTPPRPPPNVCD